MNKPIPEDSLPQDQKRRTVYRVFLLLLSVYVLIGLAIEAATDLQETTRDIFQVVDLIVFPLRGFTTVICTHNTRYIFQLLLIHLSIY